MYIFNIYIFLVMNSGAMIAKKHSAPSLSMKSVGTKSCWLRQAGNLVGEDVFCLQAKV